MPSDTVLNFMTRLPGERKLPPVMLITGPHAFLREYALAAVARKLGQEGFAYRSVQLSGAADLSALTDEVGGADLFAPKRAIVCRVMRSYRERATSAEDREDGPVRGGADSILARVIAEARPPNHLIVLYERDSAPAKVRRAAETAGLVVNCLRPFDNQLPRYVQIFARTESLGLSQRAVEALLSRHGSDLSALANVVVRLAITTEPGASIDSGDLTEPGSARSPDLFEIAESVAAGRTSAAMTQLSRTLAFGRDPVEILSVEIVPVMRRMMIAASMMKARKSAAEIASAMGLGPSSPLATRAIEGAKKFGETRLRAAYSRVVELDAAFKNGQIKGRADALSAFLLDLFADLSRSRAGRRPA